MAKPCAVQTGKGVRDRDDARVKVVSVLRCPCRGGTTSEPPCAELRGGWIVAKADQFDDSEAERVGSLDVRRFLAKSSGRGGMAGPLDRHGVAVVVERDAHRRAFGRARAGAGDSWRRQARAHGVELYEKY